MKAPVMKTLPLKWLRYMCNNTIAKIMLCDFSLDFTISVENHCLNKNFS